ncbi:cupin domain-containing protein [Flavobacteriales bacterium]|nr:cupin domain-containing protein [Flavobacteriales bacterium]
MKLNLKKKFADIDSYFSPKIIGELNEVYVKLAKIKGEKIPWHNHKEEDELFYVLEGSLLFEMEGQDSFTMNEGDMFIVKRGINHRVSSVDECKILLVENKSTAHTGDVQTDVTKTIADQKFKF